MKVSKKEIIAICHKHLGTTDYPLRGSIKSILQTTLNAIDTDIMFSYIVSSGRGDSYKKVKQTRVEFMKEIESLGLSVE